MDWIKSAGGPLICLEVDLVNSWQGIDGTSEKGTALGITDYDRACDVEDYLGCIPVGSGSGLVLGDMPLQTFVWNDRGGVIIARFMYADADAELSDIMSDLDRRCFDNPLESLLFASASGAFLMFDSAYAGSSPDLKALSFRLAPGNYRIATTPVEPDKRTSLVLHRFDKLQ